MTPFTNAGVRATNAPGTTSPDGRPTAATTIDGPDIERSPIVRLAVHAAGPLAFLLAMYELFAGHNRPGGGFAAGLLLGAVVVLRNAAGLSRPTNPITLLALGGLVTAGVALAPLLWGDVVLDMVVVKETVPVLDTVKTGTAFVFDVGVTLIVVGLVIAVIDGFGTAEAPSTLIAAESDAESDAESAESDAESVESESVESESVESETVESETDAETVEREAQR